jgi:hypothetical protein
MFSLISEFSFKKDMKVQVGVFGKRKSTSGRGGQERIM